MEARTREALNAINQAFYEREAESFSGTREHPWPGWGRLIERLPKREPLRVLDVGCGNARFGAFLEAQLQRELEYTGVDSSAALLEIAQRAVPAAELLRCDLVLDAPERLPSGPFDLITLFGVMHHIPGESARRSLLAALAERLAPAGLLVFTLWQFASDPRFDKRMLSFADQLIDATQLEAGDHLLRWGTGDAAVRYCHDTSPAELERLLSELELQGVDDYRDDGRSGELNRYLILGRRPAPS